MQQPTRSALIVLIPEAEGAVAPWRANLDTAAAQGVPAHVTVLFPFLPPEDLTDQTVTALADLIAAQPRFEVDFPTTRWFADKVLYLPPTPDLHFRALIQAIWTRFPDHPPYEGIHEEVVPHLTVGHDHPRAALREAEEAVRPHLPIHAAVTEVTLLISTDKNSWHPAHTFPLA